MSTDDRHRAAIHQNISTCGIIFNINYTNYGAKVECTHSQLLLCFPLYCFLVSDISSEHAESDMHSWIFMLSLLNLNINILVYIFECSSGKLRLFFCQAFFFFFFEKLSSKSKKEMSTEHFAFFFFISLSDIDWFIYFLESWECALLWNIPT